MAVVAMLGFDNMVLQSLTTDAPFAASFPWLMRSPVNDKDISLMQYVGTAYNRIDFRPRADPDGNQTVYFLPWSNTQASGVPAQYLYGPPFSAAGLDKTGKWYFGMCVSPALNVTANTAWAMVGDMDDATKNIPVIANGSTTNTAANFGSGTYYLEFEIDWVAKTVKGYVDGILIASTTFTTTPIAYFGNPQTAQYWSTGMQSPPLSSSYTNTSTYSLGVSHVYFAIDKAGDANPTGRLGPIRVRTVAVDTVDLVGDMKAVGAADAPTAVNTGTNVSTIPTVSVSLDSGGAKGKFHFKKPVLNANEYSIKAFQMDLLTFKQYDAAAQPVFAFTDGTKTSPDYSVVATEVPRRDFLCLSAPYAGGNWTPEEVVKYAVAVGSKPNT